MMGVGLEATLMGMGPLFPPSPFFHPGTQGLGETHKGRCTLGGVVLLCVQVCVY